MTGQDAAAQHFMQVLVPVYLPALPVCLPALPACLSAQSACVSVCLPPWPACADFCMLFSLSLSILELRSISMFMNPILTFVKPPWQTRTLRFFFIWPNPKAIRRFARTQGCKQGCKDASRGA